MCVWGLKTGIKVRFTAPFPSFAPNTPKLYILGHCINILFILQKNHISPSTFDLWINYYNHIVIPCLPLFTLMCTLFSLLLGENVSSCKTKPKCAVTIYCVDPLSTGFWLPLCHLKTLLHKVQLVGCDKATRIKRYCGQWQYITKLYLVNVNFPAYI